METAQHALHTANQLLYQKRAQLAAQRQSGEEMPVPWAEQTAVVPPSPPTTDELIRHLPSHLGWGSEPVTAVFRAQQQRIEQAQDAQNKQWLEDIRPALAIAPPSPPAHTPAIVTADGEVRLYPDIALGMLRQEYAATGRVWLLLHYLDSDGRGWLPVDEVRHELTRKESPFRIVGWRQLRNLLREGEGIFWERTADRIWLKSVANVAVALDVTRLSGRPVALPVKALCDSIGVVKAHFYASFHSGRKRGNPINRTTLEAVSGVPARTQLEYEKLTGTQKQRNIAIGECYTRLDSEKRAWLHGHAAFDFIDHQGFHGEAKRHYVAWWLPNSYSGCHQTRGMGRQRKINQRIDLVIKGRGNGSPLASKLFHPDGGRAAKAYDGQTDQFWPSNRPPVKGTGLWYAIPSQNVG